MPTQIKINKELCLSRVCPQRVDERQNIKKKRQKNRRDYKIGHCHYHLCEYHTGKKTKVYQCPYCGNWFCEKHIEPKPPYVIASNKDFSEAYYDEWAEDKGHPCPEYVEVWKEQKRREQEEYLQAMDKMKQSKVVTKEKSTSDSKRTMVDLGSMKLSETPSTNIDKENSKKTTTKSLEYYNSPTNELIQKIIDAAGNNEELLLNVLYTLVLTLAVLLVYKVTPDINSMGTVWIIRIGSLIELILLIMLGRWILKTSKLIFDKYTHLETKHKVLIILLVVFILLAAYVAKSSIIGITRNIIRTTKWDYFNPLNISIVSEYLSEIQNYSSVDTKSPHNDMQTPKINIDNIKHITDNTPSKNELEKNPKIATLTYVLNGEKKNIQFKVYGGVDKYLAGIPREIEYYPGLEPAPTTKDFVNKEINNKVQLEYLKPLVEKIKEITNNSDDQARIAISLVQHIPYDCSRMIYYDSNDKLYPYQVVYRNKGVCGEKSELLAILLRELGYGVVLFNFEAENHMAVGIKCPKQYSYYNSGYCFVESTRPTIITDDQEHYIGVGKLTSKPEIVYVSDGKSFNSAYKEYDDAKKWEQLQKESEANNYILPESEYNLWWAIANKYDLMGGTDCGFGGLHTINTINTM